MIKVSSIHLYFTNLLCHFSKCVHNTVVWKLKRSFCIGNKNWHAGGGQFGTITLLLSHAFYPRPVLAFRYCRCLRLCVRVCVYQSLACPHDNSPLVQARITKFGTKVQKTLVKVAIVFGDDQQWPSRSNLTWKSNFTSFWACPPHNSLAVQARITKFGPKMHLSTVKIPIDFGLDWFWSSLSFSIMKQIFLSNLFALFLYYI